jgi:hypothetical protein
MELRMQPKSSVLWLCAIIFLLALIAAASGLLWRGPGEVFTYTTPRGLDVQMQGRGLYRYESVSGAAQEMAQDAVTLVIGLPLLAVSAVLYRKGSLRGALLLAGTLGYFLYTYASMAFMAALNPLFLVYVAAFTCSLYAFILVMMGIDARSLVSHFTERLPRRGIVVLLVLLSAFLLMLQGSRAASAILDPSPAVLESYTTLVISVLDVGVVAPTAILAAVLLSRRSPWGYLLAAVLLVKGFTMGLAVTAMVIGQLLAGVKMSAVEIIMFPVLTLFIIYMTARMLGSLRSQPAEA